MQDGNRPTESVRLDLTNHLSDGISTSDTQTRQIGAFMGELVGYARVSSRSQSLDIQVAALTAAGVSKEHLYTEKVSGRSRDGRAALEDMLTRGVRRGDVVVCTRLDRLARSTRDLLTIAQMLENKCVGLRVIEQPVDTTTAAGRLFFTILGAFGEFEASIRAERQREGIDAALNREVSPFQGRPATIDGRRIAELHARGISPTRIARDLGVARSSVYRYLAGVHGKVDAVGTHGGRL